jgi:KipI family sensor histidine kinase inhibitor
MKKFNIASVDSFIISFSDEISLDISEKIKFYFQEINKLEYTIDVVPSYTTIMVIFDIFNTSFEKLQKQIEEINYALNNKEKESTIIEIPSYYGEEIGLDLKRISELNNISVKDIIEIHSSQVYNAFTIGFAPGFAYLGQVDKKIATPRLETPRKIVKKGSIAVADTQTAIYPQDSPGGWNIIGLTTFNMFDKGLDNLCPLSMGDKVKFRPISQKEFISLGGEI